MDNPDHDEASAQDRSLSEPIDPPPKDRFNFAWIAFLMCGAGFLMPFNSFINAVDYYNVRYPQRPIEFDISVAYMYCTLGAIFVNVRIMHRTKLHHRVYFGYGVFMTMLVAVMLLEPAMQHGVSSDVGYGLTITASGLTGLGSGVQQATFYGLAGMFPPKYTTVLMIGESFAGALVSLFRIATKAAFGSDGLATSIYIYFSLSIGWLVACICLFTALRFRPISIYYTKKTTEQIVIERNDDLHQASRVLESDTTIDFSESVGEDAALLPHQPDTHNKLTHRGHDESCIKNAESSPLRRDLPYGRIARIWRLLWPPDRAEVFHVIKYPACAVGMTLFVTLTLFPGVVAAVESKSLGDWFPLIQISVFNFCDLFGKLLAMIPYRLRPKTLLWLSLIRLILIPWQLLCVAPRDDPIFANEYISLVCVIVMGLSGGYLAALCMAEGPSMVDGGKGEIAGNIMTLFLMIGLTAGSTFALLVDYLTKL